MSESSFNIKEFFSLVLAEMRENLRRAEDHYSVVVDCLKELNPFLDMKGEVSLYSPDGQELFLEFKKENEQFLGYLERAVHGYRDISIQLRTLFSDRLPQDPWIQALDRQGGLLMKSISTLQEAGKIFIEFEKVLTKIIHQEKITPIQQKKIEDLVFRLQILG